MKTVLYFFIFVLICNTSLFAQDPEKMSYEDLDKQIGSLYEQGDYKKAAEMTQVARARAKKEFGEKDSIYAGYTVDLGILLAKFGQIEEAKTLINSALPILKAAKKDFVYAQSLQHLGNISIDEGNFEAAEQYFSESKEMIIKMFGKEHREYATIINNFAVLYQHLGRYDMAEPFSIESLDIRKKLFGVEHPVYANGLNNLATVYRYVERYEAAEKLYLEAKDIYKKTLGEKHWNYANVLNNLAQLYQKSERLEDAEKLYLQVIDIEKESVGDNNAAFAISLNNIAGCYELMKKYDKAETYYLQSLKVIEKVLGKNNPSYARRLNNLAYLYFNWGKTEKALAIFLDAEKTLKQALGTEHPDYAIGLNNLAKTNLAVGRLDSALSYAKQSFAANSRDLNADFTDYNTLGQLRYYSMENAVSSFKTFADILDAKAKASGDKAYLQQLLEVSRSAINLNERIKNGIFEESSKLTALHENSFFADKGIMASIRLGNNMNEALLFAEQNKSLILADAIKANRARSFGDLPDSIALKESQLQERYERLKKEEAEAKTEEEKLKNIAALNKTALEIDLLKKKISLAHPKYYELKYAKNKFRASELQKKLDSNTLVLEFLVSDSSTYLFSISKLAIECIPLPFGHKDLKSHIKNLRKALSDYEFIKKFSDEAYQLYCKEAFWFYQQLLSPALKNSKQENLVIITDGELGHLPFETFLTSEVREKKPYKDLPYLFLNRNISYHYSAGLWAESQNKSVTKSKGQVLGMAAEYGNKTADNTSRSLRAPHLRSLRDALVDLPAARQEVEMLSQNFSGKFFFNKEVNERFFKANAAEYDIIHLAMHGILNKQYPILSNLAFTENGDSTEDNFLEAWEISHLKLKAQLIVLSACETGYGRFAQGEGIMSLARSFMYAGTPAVVVSLWQVNDASTSAIMQLFYKNLAKNMRKSEALRKAKLEYINAAVGSRHALTLQQHPAFWAPFVIIGDDRPINVGIQSGASVFFWVLGIALIVGLFLTIFFIQRKKILGQR